MFCLHFWFLLCHCNPTDYRGHAECWGCFVLRTSETVCASEMLHPAIKTPQIKTAYANTFIFSWQTPVQRTWKMSVHCWCLSCAWSSVNASLYLFKKPRSVFTSCPVISCSCWGSLHRLCLSSEQGFPVPLASSGGTRHFWWHKPVWVPNSAVGETVGTGLQRCALPQQDEPAEMHTVTL